MKTMKKLKKILSILICLCISASFSAFAENDQASLNQEKAQEEANASVPADIPDGKVIWVDSSFKGGNGSFEAPYSSISTAQSAASKLSAAEKAEGVTVMIRGGEYELSKGLDFGSGDSGVSSSAPIVYSAYNNEQVVIKGTKKIPASRGKRVTDAATLERIKENVRTKVYEYNLKDCGINDLGKNYYVQINNGTADDATSQGHNTNTIALFYNGEEMTNSVYPNSGELFVEADAVIEGEYCVVTADSSDKARMKNWKNVSDATFMYFTKQGYEYYILPLTGGKVDSQSGKYYFLNSYAPQAATRYRPNTMARYKVVNLLEEIDVAGEWAIDYTNKKLYFYAPSEKLGDIELSMLNAPVLNIDGASNLTFKGITFGYARGAGINITNSSNITIDGCEVTCVGSDGVEITQSQNITVKNCEISHTFECGIMLNSNGKIADYKKSGILIENNDIFDTSKIAQMRGAVEIINTINAKVVNNRVHNCPAIGISLQNGGGVGTVLENNECYDTTRVGIDLSAIYCPMNSNWGTEISNNYVHDIIRYTKQYSPVTGIYLDADGSGLTIKNNIVQNVSSYGFHFNGGDCNVLENNIIINAQTPIMYSSNQTAGFDSSSADSTLDYFGGPSKAYSEAFPSLLKIIDDKGKGKDVYSLPKYNVLKNNVSMDCKASHLIYGQVEEYADEMGENPIYKTTDSFDFKDEDGYDMTFTENSKIFSELPDFKTIDFEEMGLKEKKKMEKPELIAPYNGERDVDISNSVLKWNGEYHNKYRVMIALDKSFDTMVLDETVVGTTLAPETLKYGNRTYYWKVIPVKESKSDEDTSAESEVYSFVTLNKETVDKTELRSLIKSVGKGYEDFDGYSEEAIEKMNEAYASAQAVSDSDNVKQVNVRTAVKKLKNALTELYDSIPQNKISINKFIADKNNWVLPEGTIADGTQIMIQENAPTRFAVYKGYKFKSGDMLHFNGVMNYTNWQYFGFQQGISQGFTSDVSYGSVIRDVGFEIQRYNYNENGTLSGGILGNYTNGYTTSGAPNDMEMGFMEVHNGMRLVMRVNGFTVFDHVDKSDLAISDGMYFTMYDGSFKALGVTGIEE